MGWAIFALLAALTATGLILARLPRKIWEMAGSVLLLGAAGYAWQGNPSLPGTVREGAQAILPFDEDMAKLRNAFAGTDNQAAPWITLSDGLARQGDYENAANALVAGVKSAPDNANLWVALGNMLITKSGGVVSPAAEYSYRQAMRLAPEQSGAPYFHGLALAQSGQYDAARKIWVALYARVPPQSPLHAMLSAHLARLDSLMTQRGGQ
ncbi:MAG: tetratricopeptide repeat protein [Sphingobium sp.]|nr:tetratricopeptide repeat protein [Sphingobium sp.]MBP6112490.1 tetratricopeptide repeat protein [Sphingobium sp.]MBP8670078.1 tetratricopeptide repeat protein [Sphingobium sp.]MBP9157417.1 tetratricopeptide repeat protein [Sphingobium sp.]MCC6482322.1 tetratricopeptide repeat protein [Sphingomonadaceae bacterium]